MGITQAQLAERVFNRLPGSPSEEHKGVYVYQIVSFIPQALQNLAERAMAGDDLIRAWLTKTYTIAASSGTFPLTGTSEADLLIESLPRAVVTHPNADPWPLEWVSDPRDLYYPQPGADFIYYSVENRVIHTRDQQGDQDSLTGNLTIRNAVFSPLISTDSNLTTLPQQLEDEMVDYVVAMCLEKLAPGAAAETPA